MRRSISFSIIGLGFLCLTGFSPQIALPTFQGAQARSQSDSESPIITITASDGSNAVANNSITNDATLSLTFTQQMRTLLVLQSETLGQLEAV